LGNNKANIDCCFQNIVRFDHHGKGNNNIKNEPADIIDERNDSHNKSEPINKQPIVCIADSDNE